jgi:rhodanese-related sulfurtransferase
MALETGYKALLAEAEREITTLTPEQALAMHGRDDVQFVDIRDVRELQREGTIPGAFHATRGMLEFWIDPDSPYYKPVFGEPKTFVFFCQSGWRSALATQTVQRMGLADVCHIGGGFRAWQEIDAPVEPLPPRR